MVTPNKQIYNSIVHFGSKIQVYKTELQDVSKSNMIKFGILCIFPLLSYAALVRRNDACGPTVQPPGLPTGIQPTDTCKTPIQQSDNPAAYGVNIDNNPDYP